MTAVDAAVGSGGPGECARQQRVAAYGIIHEIGDAGQVGDGGHAGDRPDSADGPDRARRILLVRAAPYLSVAGRWFLPGGGVEHGEAPLEALRREVVEETGLTVGDASLAGVLSDTWPIPDGTLLHTVRIIYRVHSWEGTTRSEAGGSSDLAQWFGPEELARLPLVRYAREALATFG